MCAKSASGLPCCDTQPCSTLFSVDIVCCNGGTTQKSNVGSSAAPLLVLEGSVVRLQKRARSSMCTCAAAILRTCDAGWLVCSSQLRGPSLLAAPAAETMLDYSLTCIVKWWVTTCRPALSGRVSQEPSYTLAAIRTRMKQWQMDMIKQFSKPRGTQLGTRVHMQVYRHVARCHSKQHIRCRVKTGIAA